MTSRVRSFIITFDVYVILNIFEKYDNKRPDPICGLGFKSELFALPVVNAVVL